MKRMTVSGVTFVVSRRLAICARREGRGVAATGLSFCIAGPAPAVPGTERAIAFGVKSGLSGEPMAKEPIAVNEGKLLTLKVYLWVTPNPSHQP
jgi:hypothetical protein